MNIEIWKPIKGYEEIYDISNLGNVRSKNYGKYKILKPGIYKGKTNRGYSSVSLSKNDYSKTFRIHKLVAEHFLEKVTNKPCINHIDGNKTNNSVNNLEYCSYKENTKHAMENNLMGYKEIKQYDKNMNFIKKYNSLREASRTTNIKESNISFCAYGKRKSAGGYIWKY